MNYDSLEVILNTTKNMQVIRDNVKTDSGVDVISGVDWFKFNNVVCNTLYVSGDSNIGFNSNTQHLKVCFRDGAMYSLFREEGTLYNYYKFLKVRWEGYTYYGSTDKQYKLVYEVFLFNKGDMFLNLIQVPTNSTCLGSSQVFSNGIYIPLGVELGTPAYITMYHLDDMGKAWDVVNEKINISYPFERKYLVRSNEKYYTLSDDVLNEIIVSVLDSQTFKNYGFSHPDNLDFLKQLPDPDLLNWNDTDEDLGNINVKCVANPNDQLFTTISYDCTDPSIKGINYITTDSDIVFQLSFDGGTAYEIYRNGWIITDDDWMNKDELQSINGEIFSARNITEYIIRMKLQESGYLKNVIVKYRNGV